MSTSDWDGLLASMVHSASDAQLVKISPRQFVPLWFGWIQECMSVAFVHQAVSVNYELGWAEHVLVPWLTVWFAGNSRNTPWRHNYHVEVNAFALTCVANLGLTSVRALFPAV